VKPSQLLREEVLRRFDRWAPIIDSGLVTQLNFTVKTAGPLEEKVLVSGTDEEQCVGLCDPRQERKLTRT